MKKITFAFFLIVSVSVPAFNARAQTNDDEKANTRVFARTNHWKATVENIDYDKRELTLKNSGGKEMTFGVSDDVKNFPQIKKGDELNVGYYEAVAFALRKPGEALTPTSRRAAVLSGPSGQKPAGAAVVISDMTATVENVDRDKREVTLRGPGGNTIEVSVDPSVGNLEQIKEGDKITTTYTEALAVSVEKP